MQINIRRHNLIKIKGEKTRTLNREISEQGKRDIYRDAKIRGETNWKQGNTQNKWKQLLRCQNKEKQHDLEIQKL